MSHSPYTRPVHEPAGTMDEVEAEGWMRLAQTGNQLAMMHLYRWTVQGVYNAVYLLCDRPEECEDLVHDAFLHAFTRLDEVIHPKHFPGWVRKIAVNRALNELRRKKQFKRWQAESERVAEEHVLPGELAVADTLSPQGLQQALARLPAGYRQVVSLHVFEQLSHEQIGEALGIAASTSRSQYSRALQKLRYELENATDHD